MNADVVSQAGAVTLSSGAAAEPGESLASESRSYWPTLTESALLYTR